MMMAYHSSFTEGLLAGLNRVEPRLLHILIGPRQAGKTTSARAVAAAWPGPVRYASADLPMPPDAEWLQHEWRLARADDAGATASPALLIVDEVQKVHRWSEVVKALWDEDRAASRSLRVLLLGSSALLLAQGMPWARIS